MIECSQNDAYRLVLAHARAVGGVDVRVDGVHAARDDIEARNFEDLACNKLHNMRRTANLG